MHTLRSKSVLEVKILIPQFSGKLGSVWGFTYIYSKDQYYTTRQWSSLLLRPARCFGIQNPSASQVRLCSVY